MHCHIIIKWRISAKMTVGLYELPWRPRPSIIFSFELAKQLAKSLSIRKFKRRQLSPLASCWLRLCACFLILKQSSLTTSLYIILLLLPNIPYLACSTIPFEGCHSANHHNRPTEMWPVSEVGGMELAGPLGATPFWFLQPPKF